MRLIANINGVDVFSDKAVQSIVNGRINFSDGSWCDVKSGKVVNKGPGSISIGSPGEKGEEQSSFGPKAYKATSLQVLSLAANVEIQPGNNPDMVVTISGSKSGVDNIQVVQKGSCLVLSPKKEGGRGSNITVSSGDVVISGGNISLGGMLSSLFGGSKRAANSTTVISMGGSQVTDVKVRIEVPRGSGVEVSGVQGEVRVGDTDGHFAGCLQGRGQMFVGKVRDTQLSIQGYGDIEVNEVNGNLNMNIQGSGDIDVKQGNVASLNISIMGSGDASFGGMADNANLTVMGSGDIDVYHVKNRPICSKMGGGDIKVSKQG